VAQTEAQKRWYVENRSAVLAARKAAREADRRAYNLRCRESMRRYRRNNRAAVNRRAREAMAARRAAHPERCRAIQREWARRNAQILMDRAWRETAKQQRDLMRWSSAGFSIVTMAQLKRPQFTVVLNGSRRSERLGNFLPRLSGSRLFSPAS
jgi:hypothetical protein